MQLFYWESIKVMRTHENMNMLIKSNDRVIICFFIILDTYYYIIEFTFAITRQAYFYFIEIYVFTNELLWENHLYFGSIIRCIPLLIKHE